MIDKGKEALKQLIEKIEKMSLEEFMDYYNYELIIFDRFKKEDKKDYEERKRID